MTIVYQAEFQEISFVRTLPDGSSDTCPINIDEISQLEKICRDYKWNQSIELSRHIGERLFNLLNGDRQTLINALREAEAHGKELKVVLKGEGTASTLPFELLYYNDFLVPSRIHLIRRVSDRGEKSKPAPENRPLRLLLMACSPLDVNPVLEFEKEEETIFEVTKDLPMEIEVEDSGSIEGLGERLATNKYDVVHITGHADIDKNGKPFFWMEDDEGLPVQVTPSQLWEKLDLNLPRLVFLSGCRTGEAPEHVAAMSFAHHLVKGHIPAVIGWGLPVSDMGASFAAQKLYFELSRGENIPGAVLRTRRELIKHYPDWSILRLFSDGTSLDIPLVIPGQKRKPKPRELQYVFLENSQVKVLKKGFIGRRRQIQQGIKCLKRDVEKVGLLLHGTGGLGKSCLAGKFCERFNDYGLIIVHGALNAITFRIALEHGFKRAKDDEGLRILEEKEEMPDKIERLCYSVFQERNYLILLDDFEKNLVRIEEGRPEVHLDAVPILESLLNFLSYTGKMTQLIITSRYTFPLTLGGEDLVQKRLESIGLTTLRDADERKKISELTNIANYSNPTVKKQLIEAGCGNPRLMEALNTLVGEVKSKDIASLLTQVKGKQEEFIQGLVLNQILKAQPEEFQSFLRRAAVFLLPVLKEGIGAVCGDMKDWGSNAEKAVRLSLMEKDSTCQESLYWVTPLIRENIFDELEEEERKKYHQTAVSYYQSLLSNEYTPILSAELIKHAVKGDLPEIAVEEGGDRFLPYLRKSLAYREALEYGNYILASISGSKRNSKFSEFIFELGYLYDDTGNPKKAIEYYEQALSIDKELYGDRHSKVATRLNNIGSAWHGLGEYKKAIEYYEQALSINKEVYGEKHPAVSTSLSNIGTVWNDLGEHKKAIEYYEQALSIDKEVYGEKHPKVAIRLSNIGLAWLSLREPKRAIEYFEQALSIDKEVYGEKHPIVAIRLTNIGGVWNELGDKKAIEYFEQALSIFKEAYGEKHPHVATSLNNLGSAWDKLGEHKKAIEYYERALSIDKEVYGEKHSEIAIRLNNIGGAWYDIGELKRAKEYFQQAYDIFREIYGNEHPHTKVAKKWLDILSRK